MASGFAVRHYAVFVEDVGAEDVGDDGMVEAVADPGPEGVHSKECAFLSELVKLGVAIEEPGADELVEDAHCKWG